jgi:molybdopterin-guanine dinucleotide biosynthesis protein A
MNFSAVIPAGGNFARMGHDKASLEVNSQTPDSSATLQL